LYFNAKQVDTLTQQMQHLLDHPEVVKSYRQLAVKRIQESYTWDRITDQYEALFRDMLK